MEYKNLDKALAYQDLVKLDKVSLKNNLTVKRIRDYQAPAGAGLTYSYAAMPVNKKYVALLSGEMMNPGEKRLVLHQLTRGNCTGSKVYADDEEKDEFYRQQLERIKDFSGRVRSGKIKSSTGKKFDTVCQIGIGGSDLGPRALYLALKGWATGEGKKQLRAEFISNVDPDDAASVLKTVNPETTLFVLVSKSGTTLETLTNQLLVTKTLKGIDMSKQLVAVTSKTSPLAKSDDVLDAFYIDDYIGGRYSSTSAVGGVILSLALGYDSSIWDPADFWAPLDLSSSFSLRTADKAWSITERLVYDAMDDGGRNQIDELSTTISMPWLDLAVNFRTDEDALRLEYFQLSSRIDDLTLYAWKNRIRLA